METQKIEQQRTREESKVNGRYTNAPRCECCGKSAGDDYYSHPDCDENGRFLHICKKCAIKYSDTPISEMVVLFPEVAK